MLTLLAETIAHLVYGKCNPFMMVGVLCATWHKVIPKFTNPKIRFQNTNIHRSVFLSPKTPGTSRWTPRSTGLHLKAMCLVQVFIPCSFCIRERTSRGEGFGFGIESKKKSNKKIQQV
jgi:hypothetical protein